MSFKYNNDIEERDRIIFGKRQSRSGWIRYFKELDADKLESLLKNNFIAPDDFYNSAPSAQEFLEFMKEYPLWRAHGYVTGGTTTAIHSDCGVFIEGIKRKRQLLIDTEEFDEYSKLFGEADEFLPNYCLFS